MPTVPLDLRLPRHRPARPRVLPRRPRRRPPASRKRCSAPGNVINSSLNRAEITRPISGDGDPRQPGGGCGAGGKVPGVITRETTAPGDRACIHGDVIGVTESQGLGGINRELIAIDKHGVIVKAGDAADGFGFGRFGHIEGLNNGIIRRIHDLNFSTAAPDGWRGKSEAQGHIGTDAGGTVGGSHAADGGGGRRTACGGGRGIRMGNAQLSDAGEEDRTGQRDPSSGGWATHSWKTHTTSF